VDLAETRAITGNALIPAGGFCLRNNNWGNAGVDGCSDNDRGTTLPSNNDEMLNPYFDVYYAVNGYPGIYTLERQQDYPMAVLLNESSARYFAFAAVATMSRGNTGDGDNGPCALPAGANIAACDARPGFFSFGDVTNGLANAGTPGTNNVIPWQLVPQPDVTSSGLADPNNPSSGYVVDLTWTGATLYSDQSHRPTGHPQMGPAEAGSADGVGVSDLSARFPLIRSGSKSLHLEIRPTVPRRASSKPSLPR